MNEFWPPLITHPLGFPGGSDGKESTRNAGDMGSIPGDPDDLLEKGKPIYSGILAWRIPMDKEAWQAIVHGVTELDKG